MTKARRRQGGAAVSDDGLHGGAAELEVAAQVFLAHVGVVGHLFGGAVVEHTAFVEEVGAVGDAEGLVDVVVGDEDADVAVLEVCDDVLDVLHGYGVDAGEGFVEEEELGVVGQGAGYLGAAALAAGELNALAAPYLLQPEFDDKRFELLLPLLGVHVLAEFEDGHDVVFDGHLAEDRGFLCQVAHAELCTAVHGHLGDFHVVEEDTAGEGLDDAHYHVEGGGLAGAVGAEEAYDFALAHVDAHLFDDGTGTVFFDYVFGSELHGMNVGMWECVNS